MNFYLFAIQMPGNCSLFKQSVMQPISQSTYDLNSELLLVRYSSHVLNNKLLVNYSSYDLNNEPFEERTILDHSNIELVSHSDPHCTYSGGSNSEHLKTEYIRNPNIFMF